MDIPTVDVRELGKEYVRGRQTVRALHDVTFTMPAGELTTVMGPSGAGKSTLLHVLGGLDTPTRGSVLLDGVELGTLDDDELTRVRRRKLGFVFQFFNLLPTLSAWENVAVPRLLDGVPLHRERDHAVELLERVGLGARVDHRPAELSGGEMQRVALARALVNDPVLVLADEPTGNLDSRTGAEVLDLLGALARDEGRTIAMVTHDAEAAAIGDRVIAIEDGEVVDDGPAHELLARS